MSTISLTAVPDYYSEQYHYERFPAKVAGRAGYFAVWSRTVDRPNPNHVTWSPETVAIVAESYRNEAWYAERAEQAARPDVAVGDQVRLGDVVIVVPKRAAQYVDGVPCEVVGAEHEDCKPGRCFNPAKAHTCPMLNRREGR